MSHFVCLVLPALPSPVVTITSLGDSVVGENYTLNCTVSIIENIVGNAILSSTWTNANGRPLESDLTITHGASTSFMLHFSPLHASDGGQYICNASVTVPELSIIKKSSQPYDIIAQSNYKLFINVNLLTLYILFYYSSPTNAQHHSNSVRHLSCWNAI